MLRDMAEKEMSELSEDWRRILIKKSNRVLNEVEMIEFRHLLKHVFSSKLGRWNHVFG